MAQAALPYNQLRSVLTTLKCIASMESELPAVISGSHLEGAVRLANTLTRDDAQAILHDLPSVAAVASGDALRLGRRPGRNAGPGAGSAGRHCLLADS